MYAIQNKYHGFTYNYNLNKAECKGKNLHWIVIRASKLPIQGSQVRQGGDRRRRVWESQYSPNEVSAQDGLRRIRDGITEANDLSYKLDFN